MAPTVLSVEEQDQALRQWRTGRSVRSAARTPASRPSGARYVAATGGVRGRRAARSGTAGAAAADVPSRDRRDRPSSICRA